LGKNKSLLEKNTVFLVELEKSLLEKTPFFGEIEVKTNGHSIFWQESSQH
jgi:hypothetical protein